jgi:hypothetical protein
MKKKNKLLREKNCPITALSTIVPMHVALSLILGVHCLRPGSDCLSHGMAYSFFFMYMKLNRSNWYSWFSVC